VGWGCLGGGVDEPGGQTSTGPLLLPWQLGPLWACTSIALLITAVVTPIAPRAAIVIAMKIVVFINFFTEISYIKGQ